MLGLISNTGDTAWLLVSAALVLFMTPGLGLFYGGMLRSKDVLAIIMQTIISIALISILWFAFGYSLAFSNNLIPGLIGNFRFAWLSNMTSVPGFNELHAPPMAYSAFQLMFAIITGALICGGGASRLKFSAFMVFVSLWFILVYAPVAHLAFSPEGWLYKRGLLDFAGGTVVEINSGFSTLGLVLALGPRLKFNQNVSRPHNIPLSLIGASIIWFGWFGFNAGSALGANQIAAYAFVNSQLSAAAGLLAWLLFEKTRENFPTTLGAASGAIVGLVAITPCAGFVSPASSVLIGFFAGLLSAFFVRFKFKLKLDDTLDVLGVHGLAGFLGTVLLGIFATKSFNAFSSDGLIYGKFHLLEIQILGAVLTAIYCTAVSFLIAFVIKKTIGLRVDEQIELQGLDLNLHAEEAYSYEVG